jgi:hypothetical protein
MPEKHLHVLALDLHLHGESGLKAEAQLLVDPRRHHGACHLVGQRLVARTGRKGELPDLRFHRPTFVFLPVDFDGLFPSRLVARMDGGHVRHLDAHGRHDRRRSPRRRDFRVLLGPGVVDPVVSPPDTSRMVTLAVFTSIRVWPGLNYADDISVVILGSEGKPGSMVVSAVNCKV